MATDDLRLAERFEIRQLAERYARGADRCDGELVASAFLPDGILRIYPEGVREGPAPRELRGRETISEAIAKLSRYQVTTHFLGQQFIEFDGSGATGETYCLAHHLYNEGDVRLNYVMSIRYLDTYDRLDGAWLIAERRLMLDWAETRRVSQQ